MNFEIGQRVQTINRTFAGVILAQRIGSAVRTAIDYMDGGGSVIVYAVLDHDTGEVRYFDASVLSVAD